MGYDLSIDPTARTIQVGKQVLQAGDLHCLAVDGQITRQGKSYVVATVYTHLWVYRLVAVSQKGKLLPLSSYGIEKPGEVLKQLSSQLGIQAEPWVPNKVLRVRPGSPPLLEYLDWSIFRGGAAKLIGSLLVISAVCILFVDLWQSMADSGDSNSSPSTYHRPPLKHPHTR